MKNKPREIAINNFHELAKTNELNERQQLIMEFFWMFPKTAFTVEQVVERFQKTYGPNVTKDNIAPRITELMQKGLISYVGDDYSYQTDPITGKTRKITRGKYQKTDLTEQPGLF